MKKTIKLLFQTFLILCMLASCSKENHHKNDEVNNITLNISIDAGVT